MTAALPATSALGSVLRPLSGKRLLAAWDCGDAQDNLDRAVTMLAAARPEAAREEIEALTLPALTRELLRLRLVTLGPALAGVVPCPSCGARLEFVMSLPSLLERLERLDAGDRIEWTQDGVAFALRAAVLDDVRQAALGPDAPTARRVLLERCLTIAAGATALTPHDAAADPVVVERFERLHAGAEVACAVRCPVCGDAGSVDLDIGQFLWEELRHAALRLLHDVHDLASAYGWPEATIVGMSDRRRRAYLAMVQA